MVPARCAVNGCSIFIASRTTIRSPTSTDVAVAYRHLDDGPLHRCGELVAAVCARRMRRRATPSTYRRAGAALQLRRQHDLEPLTANFDGDASRALVHRRSRRRSETYGAIVLTNSVSIHRVCTVNGVFGSNGANAGSSTTARWNGSAVAMPSTSNSASARRARASASRARRAGHDQLGQQRVEGLRHDCAGRDTGVEPHAWSAGRPPHRHLAWSREETAPGVLAVDPEFDRVPAQRRIVVPQRLAVRESELLADQVDARRPPRTPGARPGCGCSPRGTRSCRPRRAGTHTCPRRRSRPLARCPSTTSTTWRSLRPRGMARELLRPASDDAVATSSRVSRSPRRPREHRQGIASRRAAVDRGSARRSTRHGRTR